MLRADYPVVQCFGLFWLHTPRHTSSDRLFIAGNPDFHTMPRISHLYEFALIRTHVNVPLGIKLCLFGVLEVLLLDRPDQTSFFVNVAALPGIANISNSVAESRSFLECRSDDECSAFVDIPKFSVLARPG